MRQQLSGCGTLGGITHKHPIQKRLQTWRHLVSILQIRRLHVPYASHRLQWWLIEERRLPVDHFDNHYAQRPNVHLRTVGQTWYNLRGHPVGGAHQWLALGQLLRYLRTETKVRKLHAAIGGEQNRVRFDVAMNDALQRWQRLEIAD